MRLFTTKNNSSAPVEQISPWGNFPQGQLSQWLAAAAWLMLWQLCCSLVDLPLLLPSPGQTASRLVQLAVTADFWLTVGATFSRICSGCGWQPVGCGCRSQPMGKNLFVPAVCGITGYAGGFLYYFGPGLDSLQQPFHIYFLYYGAAYGVPQRPCRNKKRRPPAAGNGAGLPFFLVEKGAVFVPAGGAAFFCFRLYNGYWLCMEVGNRGGSFGNTRPGCGQRNLPGKNIPGNSRPFCLDNRCYFYFYCFGTAVCLGHGAAKGLPFALWGKQIMIFLKNITVSYNKKSILQNFSLTLPEQGAVCLFAPSGSGKTTLLSMIAGLKQGFSGQVQGLKGKKVSVVFQENRLLPGVTALSNVSVALPKGQEQQAAFWLEQVGLREAANLLPEELSGGMHCPGLSLGRGHLPVGRTVPRAGPRVKKQAHGYHSQQGQRQPCGIGDPQLGKRPHLCRPGGGLFRPAYGNTKAVCHCGALRQAGYYCAAHQVWPGIEGSLLPAV